MLPSRLRGQIPHRSSLTLRIHDNVPVLIRKLDDIAGTIVTLPRVGGMNTAEFIGSTQGAAVAQQNICGVSICLPPHEALCESHLRYLGGWSSGNINSRDLSERSLNL